jgi:beta-lactamase class A
VVERSRRSKRKKNPSTNSPVTSSTSKVVSLSSRRRRPKANTNTVSTTPTKPLNPSPTTPQRRTKRTNVSANSNSRTANRTVRRFRLKLPKPILYPLRFIIVGVGIGALIGTLLAISNSRPYINVTQNVDERGQALTEQAPPDPLPLITPLTTLQDSAKQAISVDTELDAALLFVDLDTGEYVDVAASRSLSAASTIKIPVLIAFLEAVDQGKARLDDPLILSETTKGSGSGSLQYKDDGSQFPALYVATEMSVNSNNTATNMIIDLLGGNAVLNAKFQEWGLQQTILNTPLPDLDGTNLTSPRDLAYLLARVSQGEILSPRSRDRLMRIMSSTENDRLLPQSLGAGASIAHKTGDIGFIIGDVGIVDMPNGKRYIASIFVERPYNSPKGKELLHQIASEFYQYLEKATPPSQENTPPQDAAPTPIDPQAQPGAVPETASQEADPVTEAGIN